MICKTFIAVIVASMACLSFVNAQGNVSTSVAAPTVAPPSGVICTQQNVFRLCIRNWIAGGGPAVCEIDKNDDAKYYRCLCQQYSNQAYCFQAFCPSDPTLIKLRDDANSACVRARVTLTAQTEFLLATEPITAATSTSGSGVTPAPVASTATVVTPSSTPLSFPSPAGALVPNAFATLFAIIAGLAVVLAVRQ